MSETRPLFSIVHPSARPGRWESIYKAWTAAAVYPDSVEYVLVKDTRWGFDSVEVLPEQRRGCLVQILNRGRRCYVDAVNTGAAVATGSILVVVADDQYPCEGWDAALYRILFDRFFHGENGLSVNYDDVGAVPFVVEVSTGTPQEHDRGIFVLPILSRARYEQVGGWVFYGAYESMYADNDLASAARRDGVVVEARELLFPHRHPLADETVPVDAQYEAQNRPEAYRMGQIIFEHRSRLGFTGGPPFLLPRVGPDSGPVRRTLALCLTGDDFRGPFVDALLALQAHLLLVHGFEVVPLRGYTSNVYVTRLEVWNVLHAAGTGPDLLLWIDHDNMLSPDQFDTLLMDLDGRPDVGVVAAWCWIHDSEQKRFQVSAGTWAPDGSHWLPFDPRVFPGLPGPQSAEVTGFPVVLMRGGLLHKLGRRPFLNGILDERLPVGIGGEDMAFCRACRENGVSILVDPRLRVPHLKWMQIVPEFEPAGLETDFRLVVMIRAKNEGRWIRRVVASVAELGPVYLMDDGSQDDTAAEAEAAGAVVVRSPFVGLDLDERRDKNWLLDLVRERESPDWVLCIDGDEELQRGGVQKVRRACSVGTAAAYAVKFLHLWDDSPNRVRLDRWYSTFTRFSLFRVLPGLTFKSLYEGRGVNVHSGLHTGNVPFADGLPSTGVLDVFLIHYGYMCKADRLRKFAYYNGLDPLNALEDQYRHVVQGDIPEVPAGATLRHAGPLDVRTLPASLAPDWSNDEVRAL